MTVILILPLAASALFLTWCLLLIPRRNQPGWDKLGHFRYAHRGLHDAGAGIPENSLTAFQRAVSQGFGAELDVHLMADGNLAVIHDSSLKRVCGKEAVIEKLTLEDLKDYPLSGNGERIPLLEEVLALFKGKTPLIIELKAVRGNSAPLTRAVMTLLEGWDGSYCIESFHPAVLIYLKKHYPAVLRGQLSENFLKNNEIGKLSLPIQAVLALLLTTCFTRPDFIAYNHKHRSCPSLRMMKRLYGIHEVGWTIQDRDTMKRLEQDGVTPIFENFLP